MHSAAWLTVGVGCRDHLGYYEALGLEPGVTTPDIKNAFRQAALIWHPDRQKVCLHSTSVVLVQ